MRSWVPSPALQVGGKGLCCGPGCGHPLLLPWLLGLALSPHLIPSLMGWVIKISKVGCSPVYSKLLVLLKQNDYVLILIGCVSHLPILLKGTVGINFQRGGEAVTEWGPVEAWVMAARELSPGALISALSSARGAQSLPRVCPWPRHRPTTYCISTFIL